MAELTSLSTQAPPDGRGLFDSSLPADWETLVNEGIEARKLGDSANWRLGDLAARVETHYGGHDLEKYAERIEVAHASLQSYRTVAGRFAKSIRIDNLSWAHHQVVAAREDAEEWLARAEREGWSIADLRRKVEYARTRAIQSSESNEWYTPAQYIEAARVVLGGIDLDPASHPIANETVSAQEFFTQEDDGLSREWSGRVWLNPPWGNLAASFVEKLVAEHKAGNVSEAIVLVNAHGTDTSWFQPLWDYCLCFTDHRIDFQKSDSLEPTAGSTHGSVFVYLGPHPARFVENFRQFGAVVERA